MTAERDPMTLNESSAPALGVEERSDEAPRAGRARPTPDPEVVAKPKRRQFTAQYRLRILEEAERCTQPGEVGRLLRREGLVVQLPSDGLAQGAAQGFASGVGPEEARRKAGRTPPAGCEGARARGESGSPGARAAHRAHDLGRPKVGGLYTIVDRFASHLMMVDGYCTGTSSGTTGCRQGRGEDRGA